MIKFNPAISKNAISKNMYTDLLIKQELEKLGLQTTGSKEADIKAIQNALTQKGLPNENKISNQEIKQHPPRTPEAVAAFMEKLGLQPTNSKEGDAALITAKLNELESKATSPSDKDNVQSLREEFAAIVAQSGSVGQQQAALMNMSFFNLKS